MAEDVAELSGYEIMLPDLLEVPSQHYGQGSHVAIVSQSCSHKDGDSHGGREDKRDGKNDIDLDKRGGWREKEQSAEARSRQHGGM